MRPVANLATGGVAAPVVSTLEDVSAFALVTAAIFVPVLAGVLLIALVVAAIALLRRRRRLRPLRAGAQSSRG